MWLTPLVHFAPNILEMGSHNLPGLALSSQDYKHEPLELSSDISFKTEKTARCWWRMPVILATREAEIRRIVV
jgi:hypothetical protein